ncbi:MAG TPA: helix-turn-helix domain-containing GNAT family N-acetyltransferase [Acidimicrobiia bacterium]|jgi:DNA-binding MarR family transcriptional regulator/N-acetylglutamate synthase-like GNAT family acetyltransferase
MIDDAVTQVRVFNRTVTRRVGALDDHFLGRGRPLAESRLLFEIGLDGADVRDLRARLGLDSGYVSRMLRALEQEDLVAIGPAPHDRRVRRATLTGAGRREYRALDGRSDAFAAGLLESLSEGQRTRLVAAMAEVTRLLTAAAVTIDVVDPAGDQARWCIRQYYVVLAERFAEGFDDAVITQLDDADLQPPSGVFVVGSLDGRPVACGALRLYLRDVADIKRMWVSPDVRGLGLGRRLIGRLEQLAADMGCDSVRLETNRSLTEAITLYRSTGYTEVERFNDEPYAHHWFQKRLVD